MHTEYITIPLNGRKYQGLVAIIDAADYELVSAHRWFPAVRKHTTYAYAHRREGGDVLLHRLIMGVGKGEYVDHISGDGLDNRRSNLRIATQTQNNGNTRIKSHNTSGYKGVYQPVPGGKYRAMIKGRYIGQYDDLVEAAIAYDDHARRVFGEFARVNFPKDGELPARPDPRPE